MRANGRASGPVLTSQFLLVLDRSAVVARKGAWEVVDWEESWEEEEVVPLAVVWWPEEEEADSKAAADDLKGIREFFFYRVNVCNIVLSRFPMTCNFGRGLWARGWQGENSFLFLTT